MGFSVIDPAVICDRTDFNILKKEAFDATSRAIERFYKSYSKDKTPDEGEYRPFFPS
jgi:hypothetical protein